jgi:hypothetical protein
MSLGKRGIVSQVSPITSPLQGNGDRRSSTWLRSLAFGSGIALLGFVSGWLTHDLGYATRGAILLFCCFTALFSIGEINVRALVRAIQLGVRGDFRKMLQGLIFVAVADVVILAGIFIGYLLSNLAGPERSSGPLTWNVTARAACAYDSSLHGNACSV